MNKTILFSVVAAMSAAAVLILGVACNRSSHSIKFQRDLDQFVADASRLDALTIQGVNRYKFGDQLATVSADFSILFSEWPSSYSSTKRVLFEKAVKGWSLTYAVWTSQPSDSEYTSSDDWTIEDRLIHQVCEYLRPMSPSVPSKLEYRPARRALMTVASRYFAKANADGIKQ
jgi:hypothetical protein